MVMAAAAAPAARAGMGLFGAGGHFFRHFYHFARLRVKFICSGIIFTHKCIIAISFLHPHFAKNCLLCALCKAQVFGKNFILLKSLHLSPQR